MLLSFQVSNHKSIRDEQTLHMQPVHDKSNPALPVAAIFGANAAGKSNILDALSFMAHAVRHSLGHWEPAKDRKPFRLDPDTAAKPSRFAVELRLDGVRYDYGFTIDDNQVHEEWLYSYPLRRKRVIFERNKSGTRVPVANSHQRGMARFAIEALPKSLFLSMDFFLRLGEVESVRRWFHEGITFVDPTNDQLDEAALITKVAETDRDYARRLVNLVRAADVGIEGIEAKISVGWSGGKSVALDPSAHEELTKALSRDTGEDPDLPDTAEELRLIFHQGRNKTRMSIAEQSHGTRVWLKYLLPMLRALDGGRMLVVDEIDTSLHPRLTAQLIALFRDPETNPLGAQLVFTTHDASLLSRLYGEAILGRDEVWFVDKDPDGASSLYALADFKPQKDENIERRYLTGSYGAVPNLFDIDFQDGVATQSEGSDERAAG